jgi:hypothetical protein
MFRSIRTDTAEPMAPLIPMRAGAPARAGSHGTGRAPSRSIMSLCALCGLTINTDAGICAHHHCSVGDDWATANRLICDFLHRGKVLERLPAQEREDDFWAHAGEGA